MLLMGDEIRQTRQGNNNPWCQDNELNWLDWDLVQRHENVLRFVKLLIAFTGELEILNDDRFWFASSPEKTGDITWHGLEPDRPDWSEESRCIAYCLESSTGDQSIYVMYNASEKIQEFQPPALASGWAWHQLVDTAMESSQDFLSAGGATIGENTPLRLVSKSCVILIKKESNI